MTDNRAFIKPKTSNPDNRAMLAALRTVLTKWFQSPPKAIEADAPEQKPSIPEFLLAHHEGDEDQPSHPVPYDENLLERTRTQWQFGDWPSLAQLNRDILQHHPDRAKLALLAAAGRLQTGSDTEAKQFIRLAQNWGVSKKLLTRILAAGVHNSLGRAAAIAGEQPRALQHFHSAVCTGTPGSEARLLAQARISHQYQQLGLPPVVIGSLETTVPPAPSFLQTASTR
jgi:hypothetical protein